MARKKGKPRNQFKGFPNVTLIKLLNAPRVPYFRVPTVETGTLLLGGHKPIMVGGPYQPGAQFPLNAPGPVIILKGRREQARRLRQMGRGAS